MTKKQRQLLSFIDKFITEHGYSPSYREIMKNLSYKSVSTVATHVDNLVASGYLTKTNHSARTLEVSSKTHAPPAQKTKSISISEQKWLVDIVTEKFALIEKNQPSQKQVDDLFVLVGALAVLGFNDAALSFKARLSALTKDS